MKDGGCTVRRPRFVSLSIPIRVAVANISLALAFLYGCIGAPTAPGNSNLRCNLVTRTAVRCQDGSTLLFFEPRLEVAGIPAGAQARFYLGQTLLKDTAADASGNLSFTASVSTEWMPKLSLVLGKDSLVWDPADSMAVKDTMAAPFSISIWAAKDSGQQVVSSVKVFSLVDPEKPSLRIPCGGQGSGTASPLDGHGSYDATHFTVEAEVVALGDRYSFAAATGESILPDSIFAEQKSRFPVLLGRTAPLQRKKIRFQGKIPHLPVTLQMSLGADLWRYRLSRP